MKKRKREKESLNVVILAPHYPGAIEFETMNNVKVYRFPYFYLKNIKDYVIKVEFYLI